MARLKGTYDTHLNEMKRAIARARESLRLANDSVRCSDRWHYYFNAQEHIQAAQAAAYSADASHGGAAKRYGRDVATGKVGDEIDTLFHELEKTCLRSW